MAYQEIPTDDQVKDCDDLWNAQGLDMAELFCNEVPHVRGERVIKPSGMPPADWSLAS
jgi:hypothetical protein